MVVKMSNCRTERNLREALKAVTKGVVTFILKSVMNDGILTEFRKRFLKMFLEFIFRYIYFFAA